VRYRRLFDPRKAVCLGSIDRLPRLSNSNEDHRRSTFATTPYIDDRVI